jgi:NADPH:quinone reductase
MFNAVEEGGRRRADPQHALTAVRPVPTITRRCGVRAVRIHAHGGPEALALDELPVPRPAPGELLVRTAVVGVGRPDVRLARAAHVAIPHTPGGDVAGRVEAVGEDVTGWEAGDRVVALAFGGAYADFVTVPAAFAAPVPECVDDEAAVVLVRCGQVALGVLRAARVGSGESVLVTAAAGGVGHLAVQLARVLGASRVVAAIGARSPAKVEALRSLGADEVVTYAELAAEGVEPVDVVADGAGGDVQAAALAVLAPFGRLVAFSAATPAVDVDQLRLNARTVIGFAMAHHAGGRPEVYARHRAELWDLYRGGRLRPLVDRVLPLEEAGDAHRTLEGRENVGRVLLRAS